MILPPIHPEWTGSLRTLLVSRCQHVVCRSTRSNRGVAVLARLKGECHHGSPIRRHRCAMRHLLPAAQMEFAKLEGRSRMQRYLAMTAALTAMLRILPPHHDELRQAEFGFEGHVPDGPPWRG
jgi:hypothetical protein